MNSIRKSFFTGMWFLCRFDISKRFSRNVNYFLFQLFPGYVNFPVLTNLCFDLLQNLYFAKLICCKISNQFVTLPPSILFTTDQYFHIMTKRTFMCLKIKYWWTWKYILYRFTKCIPGMQSILKYIFISHVKQKLKR